MCAVFVCNNEIKLVCNKVRFAEFGLRASHLKHFNDRLSDFK